MRIWILALLAFFCPLALPLGAQVLGVVGWDIAAPALGPEFGWSFQPRGPLHQAPDFYPPTDTPGFVVRDSSLDGPMGGYLAAVVCYQGLRLGGRPPESLPALPLDPGLVLGWAPGAGSSQGSYLPRLRTLESGSARHWALQLRQRLSDLGPGIDTPGVLARVLLEDLESPSRGPRVLRLRGRDPQGNSGSRLVLAYRVQEGVILEGGRAVGPGARVHVVDPTQEIPSNWSTVSRLEATYLEVDFSRGRVQLSPAWAQEFSGTEIEGLSFQPEFDADLGSNRMPLGEVLSGQDRLEGSHHPALVLSAQGDLRLGESQGVVLGSQGGMQLLPGVNQGEWRSPLIEAPQDAAGLQFGVVANAPAGSRWVVRVRSFQGLDAGPWVRVDRETEWRLDQAQALQVAIQLSRAQGAESPVWESLSATPFTPAPVLGQGEGSTVVAPPVRPPQGFEAGIQGPATVAAASPAAATRTGAVASPRPPSGSAPLSIRTREQWGGPRPSGLRDHTPQTVTIHHTASKLANYKPDAAVKEIWNYHVNGRGYSDMGYHFVIGPEGTIYEGRPVGKIGAHSPPNTGRIGICLAGNFESDTPTPASLEALTQLLAKLYRDHGIGPGKTFGHRDQRPTACPGEHLYPQIQALENGARSRL